MSCFVRSIRDDNGREIGWYCNGCGKPVTVLWGELCRACQGVERRNQALIRALTEYPTP